MEVSYVTMGTVRGVLGLVIAFVVTFTAAAIGSAFTARSVGDWYVGLARPPWTPPSWVFGPVWTLLYSMMAVAAWIVWRRAGPSGAALPLALFGIQLALNVGWSAVFFGLRMPGAAFAEIVLLWLSILATLLAFWRVGPVAGALLLPYLGWVSFAAALNLAIWRLNT